MRSTIVCGPIVRRTTSTSTSVWIEFGQDTAAYVKASPAVGPGAKKPSRSQRPVISNASYTVNVGGRFYVLLELKDLLPGWMYKYRLLYRETEGARFHQIEPEAGSWYDGQLENYAVTGGLPAFRTFPAARAEETRVAFGSCRRFGGGFYGAKGIRGEDVFPLFGQHLKATAKDRMTSWPHLLLLLGDQIYADDVYKPIADSRRASSGRAGKKLRSLDAPESILEWESDRRPGETKSLLRQKVFFKDVDIPINIPDYAGYDEFTCIEFEDFAALYINAWTDPDVARVLANLPTFMICDDHEIADNWNLTGSWVDQMLRTTEWPEAVIDGMVAYWMYQGWGNPDPPGGPDGRVKILQKAAPKAKDALGDLRDWFSQRITPGSAPYHYRIEITPPILVLDTRCDRNFVTPKERGPNKVVVHADFDDEILGEEQWKWLLGQIDHDGPLVLASGVPFLQFLCADVFFMMARSDIPLIQRFEEADQDNADIMEYYRRNIGTDQWTSFPKSFVRLVNAMLGLGPFIFLSGDVHYSYAMYGRASFLEICNLEHNPLILHAVSSPLRSQWTDKEKKRNTPDRCPGITDDASGELMLRNAIHEIDDNVRAKVAVPCDPSQKGAQWMRVFMPDADYAFDGGKTKWTHLNNIAALVVSANGKTVKTTWHGATKKKGQVLEEIGSIQSPPGKFVR